MKLQIIVSGAHLSPEYGLSAKFIEDDGFLIDETVEILLSSDTSVGTCKSMGLGLIGFADVLSRLNPDWVVILGDRFEAFSAAAACMVSGIPIAHIHGGESTQGAIDESIRHAITKMGHLHFTSTVAYQKRVVQLGEDPAMVFHVGALGIENIRQIEMLDKKSFEQQANISLGEESVLVTFHPVTLEKNSAEMQLDQLLTALDHFDGLTVLFTQANADEQGRLINNKIKAYVAKRSSACFFTSMGQLLYLNAVHHVQAVVGNSSSGIIEAPSLKTPTVNIGNRQKGRIQADSIVNCEPMCRDIVQAIEQVLSEDFQKKTASIENPYDKPETAKQITQILKRQGSGITRSKSFYDIDFEFKKACSKEGGQ